MTTGYWVSGSTTNRTKVHLVQDGRAICGFRQRTRRVWQICGLGIHLSLVECARCKARGEKLKP